MRRGSRPSSLASRRTISARPASAGATRSTTGRRSSAPASAVAAALRADLRAVRRGPPRSLHRLHPLLGDPRRRADRTERALAPGAGREALRGARARAADRRGPGRGHAGGDRAARAVPLPGHQALAVRLRHRSAGGDLSPAQLRPRLGGLHRDARQRHHRGLVPRSRLAPALPGAMREGAPRRAGLPRRARRRPRDPLGHDARRLVLGGEPGGGPRAGPARARVGGADEPAGDRRGQLGMADGEPSPRGHPGPPSQHDRDVPQERAVRRRPWEMRRGQLREDPQWYKDAIIYELRVRSFMDSNGDGIGDFPGLTSRLDYLQDLGVSALWLLPICPSPGKDDGHDISDYTDVHPDVGTLDDFRVFVAEAHRRGLRVITELVLTHPSDQPPWFQRAGRAPAGSRERDFYVWSDTPARYGDARIIFKDFEPSNWSWDPLAKQYYWHRFFAHQPDLNFDNPAVHDAMFSVVDFWFELGVDGLRLDAVPYLFERDGTNCENLPETHGFLKKLRAHVDARFKNRMLLAEANQWPEDAARYYGEGDECHMNFHFPIMPRIFMSIHMEDRLPIIDILEQTPQIPQNCQWALFLRNHDELTLEMVTDEERDYMYRAFAHEPTMRINLGIRRRLAPLVGNDRRQIELMNALLFSLPGTPVLYYGDEIGMGDNVFLGDRNGVRTPMQWSPDRNAGYSRANPQRLILPVIIDPEYHYESLNVESQQANANSLLWWMKRLIALRKRFQAFGRGTIEFLQPENPKVLAFIRQFEDETVLVVANLSRFTQYVELDLRAFKGRVPQELMGRTRFPPIGELPYLLTLGEHAFSWFRLEEPRHPELVARESQYQAPLLEVASAWEGVFSGAERAALEMVLPAWLEGRLWFEPRGREISQVRIADVIQLDALRITLAQIDFGHGESEHYVVPLGIEAGEKPASPQAVIAVLRRGDGSHAFVVDALFEPAAAKALLEAMRTGTRSRGMTGLLGASSRPGLPGGEPRLYRSEHHAACLQYG